MESHNIEWKITWRDEYIKWIAGFANANGGILYIGKSDKGEIIGLINAKQILEEIPNKVRDLLGILVEVNLLSEKGKEYIEIIVEAHSFPVSYKGEYHYRSGSTKQELKGNSLNRFLLQKSGIHWDGFLLPNLKIIDLDNNAFDLFRKQASNSKRVSDLLLMENSTLLLENLHLIENNQLKRACSLLFYANPEKYTTGAYIKIGYFETDSDLLFYDEIHGNLFHQIERTMDLLLTKYLIASIRYEGIARIEAYNFPELALREAILNAIAHKDYGSGIPIQISIYEDKIQIWNEGKLPNNWTFEILKQKHPSKPANPDIANTLFRAGMIESWGRGISKILDECQKVNLPEPIYDFSQGGIMVTFKTNTNSTEKMTEKMTEKTTEKTTEKIINLILENNTITILELSIKIGITRRNIEKNIEKLKLQNRLKRIGPDNGGKWEVL